MAEAGSASSDASLPADSGSSAPVNPDWEMLSMSMSASALGKSDVSNEPDKSNLQIDSSFSQVSLPSEESHNAGFNDAAFGSDAWVRAQPSAVNKDGSSDFIAEPFTEGWKPHLSTSSDLYGYRAERGYVEQNQPVDTVLSHQDSEKFHDSNASIVRPTESSVSKKEGAGVLSSAHADDVGYDYVSAMPRRKVGKKPRRQRVVWSIAVAATMVGIAVLGHRWRLAYRDNQQLRLELSAKDEKLNDLLYQVNRLKDIVGGYHHRVPVNRNSGI